MPIFTAQSLLVGSVSSSCSANLITPISSSVASLKVISFQACVIPISSAITFAVDSALGYSAIASDDNNKIFHFIKDHRTKTSFKTYNCSFQQRVGN
jgi:hypothetical protein